MVLYVGVEKSNKHSIFNQTCNNAVKLKIGFIPLKYDALVSGSFSGNHLNYTVTVNAEYSNAPFTAIVTFEGTK